ncbi:MAG: hypothetical protein ACI9R8_001334, partial [Candidatus Paceibacteria bacterium]
KAAHIATLASAEVTVNTGKTPVDSNICRKGNIITSEVSLV